jgi:hypothetical protein
VGFFLNKAWGSVSRSLSPAFLAGPIFVQIGIMGIKHVSHRVHRWHRRPRFRTPKIWIVLALLILATLLVLPRGATPPAVPSQLPTFPKPEPVLPSPPEAPSPAPTETSERGCPQGCASPPPGCVIKGNISQRTGERIYHLPGQRWYDKTVISPEDGEAWFCTEDEARENGWRKSKV